MVLALMRAIPFFPRIGVKVLLGLYYWLEYFEFLFVFLFHPVWKLGILSCDNIANKYVELLLSYTVFIYFFHEDKGQEQSVRLY